MKRAFVSIGFGLLAIVLLLVAGLTWLRIDAHRDHDAALASRHGTLIAATHLPIDSAPALSAERVRLRADSGLAVTVRVLRPKTSSDPLPVLILLGGHRTGSNAVALIGNELGARAIVALDYPYDGTLQTDGLIDTLTALPSIRQAFFDAAPAIWLTLDWLQRQSWAKQNEFSMVGVSLGVPFAATAAARDERIRALMLVHGAADNRAWIAHNVERRLGAGWFNAPLSTTLNWVVYGPLHDTAAHVAEFTPRPVVIVGARQDERVPVGETKRLYSAAREPRSLRWTGGSHVRPGRREVIDELLAVAADELQ